MEGVNVVEYLRGMKRTHRNVDLGKNMAGERVTLMGWVHRRRDHGGLIFVDLRDRSGLVQVVFSPDTDIDAFRKAEAIRSEYVLAVSGVVTARPEGTVNPNLVTGEIEVYSDKLAILNTAKTTPFYLGSDNLDVDETVRLKYRYLDLRRPEMQEALILRHRVAKAMRDFLDRHDFLEIETPMLTKSSPEGARDYLVPSRVHPGEFFALPQSPQIFKQILMVAGMERYFQIVRCFRDEDLRADRQPEFTQLDIEMSFIERDDLLALMEEMMAFIFRETVGVVLQTPFGRLTYQEAMDRFGSDKPDLRFGMELVNVSDIVVCSEFKVFAAAVSGGGQVKGLCVPGCASFSRKELDDLTAKAAGYGAKGLAWMLLTDEGVKSPIAKFFTDDQTGALVRRMEGKTGDLLLFVADKPGVVADVLGRLRVDLGKRLGMIDPNELNFSWLTDFPVVEWDEEDNRYTAIHHMFTAPVEEDLPLMDTEPAKVRAQAYDLILNGVELGGGSIRIYQREVQEKMFALLGLSESEQKEKFGYMLEAFEYGTPPHGGIAFGLDRMVMLMSHKETVRDVIAFPKTQSATCLMTQAPSPVVNAQLKELHVKLDFAAKGKNN